MFKLPNIIFYLFLLGPTFKTFSQNEVISSPDLKTTLVFKIDKQKDNSPFYSVKHQGKVILADSPLGFEFENQPTLKTNLDIVSTKTKLVNTTWSPVYGERNQYPELYNEVTINLIEKAGSKRSFELTFRAYNEGIAFRYTLHPTQSLIVTRELTGFKFNKDYASWITISAQGKYIAGSISKTQRGTERPYVIELNPNQYIALGEAALLENARMKFDRSKTDSLLLVALMDSQATYTSTFSTPWRYLMIADSPGKLLENNYFILNLNTPNAIKDVSWIKPGKVIRESTLTTIGAKSAIDFASRHNLQYIEFDAGWYGHEYNIASDATGVHVDPSRSPGPLALQEVIDYGKSKNIGIILYVNQKALTRQIDTILPLYRAWGIKGVKYGFVDVGSQASTQWLYKAVQKAAANKLMLDIHDEFRPTGFSRTYPNLLTQEGIRGDEESTENRDVLITIFTRMLAGAGDQTNCYFAPRVTEKMGSHASQMAKAICIYSPWQFLYWYDRPENYQITKEWSGSTTTGLNEIPDLAFYDALPTVWDETKVLEGKIGEYATIARRSGNKWFIGSFTQNPHNVSIPLNFLNNKKKYNATIYSDDPHTPTPTHIKISKQSVAPNTKLQFELKTKNGIAIILEEK